MFISSISDKYPSTNFFEHVRLFNIQRPSFRKWQLAGELPNSEREADSADNGGNFPDLESAGWAIRAIAQITPTISRAIPVLTTTFGLPAAASRR
jgi:hypothetical protein